MKALRLTAASAAAAGAYALWEPRRFRLVERWVAVGAACPPLSVLHLSDTHLTGRTRHLAAWLSRLPDELGVLPDLVLATGDLIDNNSGISGAVEALAGIEARLGRFYVLGSHDYYVSKFTGYSKYLRGAREPRTAARAHTARLEEGLASKGWESLTNGTRILEAPEGKIRVAGVDDPYLSRHRTEHIQRSADEICAIGLVHCPDVVSEWILAGFDLVVGGHTHGGQVGLPGGGALVTNSALPNALASGLHRIGGGWLHVSPGLGVGRFSPVRFGARPEATLLRMAPSALHREGRRL